MKSFPTCPAPCALHFCVASKSAVTNPPALWLGPAVLGGVGQDLKISYNIGSGTLGKVSPLSPIAVGHSMSGKTLPMPGREVVVLSVMLRLLRIAALRWQHLSQGLQSSQCATAGLSRQI